MASGIRIRASQGFVGFISTGLLFVAAWLSGCSTHPPSGVAVVTPFDVQRYEGKWYEIARLDHRFERGLTDISATYRRQPDGSVQVINRGYDGEDREWNQAVGGAFFTGDSQQGSLKVSFFGPFYGGYHVVALDRITAGLWSWGRIANISGFWPGTSNCPGNCGSNSWNARASWV
jgi:lipocalin